MHGLGPVLIIVLKNIAKLLVITPILEFNLSFFEPCPSWGWVPSGEGVCAGVA